MGALDYAKAILCALLVMSAGATAHAQLPRGVVLRFEGSGSARVRSYAVRGLRRRADAVRRRDVEEAAARGGYDLNTSGGRFAIAQELSLQFLLGGTVQGQLRPNQQ